VANGEKIKRIRKPRDSTSGVVDKNDDCTLGQRKAITSLYKKECHDETFKLEKTP
jgi:hypothetical protein